MNKINHIKHDNSEEGIKSRLLVYQKFKEDNKNIVISKKERYLLRYNKMKELGLCHECGIPCDDRVTCTNCSLRQRDRELNNIKKGMCRGHPERPVVQGKKACKECLWYAILYTHPSVTDEQVTKVLEQQNYICPITGHKLEKGINASIDHITPIGKNRFNENHELNKIDNIRIVDERVNRWKEGDTDKDFIQLCRDIVTHQDKLKQAEQNETKENN